jgi:2,4-dienoyl-CoA reductase-like NADH-dependent reductase (Old Yellow Enzyme family)
MRLAVASLGDRYAWATGCWPLRGGGGGAGASSPRRCGCERRGRDGGSSSTGDAIGLSPAGGVVRRGALLIAQLNHGGRQHFSRRVPTLWAPSALACPRSGGVPHEMTPAEIEDVIEGFVRSAVHAREAGLDGVEVHGAQGHLVGRSFHLRNQRTDEWGGSFENRLRFPRRIIQAVRDRVGRDVMVGYRLGVEEFTPGGVTLEESTRVAREFAREGLIDYLSLSQGNFNTLETHLPDRHFR